MQQSTAGHRYFSLYLYFIICCTFLTELRICDEANSRMLNDNQKPLNNKSCSDIYTLDLVVVYFSFVSQQVSAATRKVSAADRGFKVRVIESLWTLCEAWRAKGITKRDPFSFSIVSIRLLSFAFHSGGGGVMLILEDRSSFKFFLSLVQLTIRTAGQGRCTDFLSQEAQRFEKQKARNLLAFMEHCTALL